MQIELDPHPERPKPQASVQPPGQANPYASPRAPIAQPDYLGDQIAEVAKAQRMLLVSVLASLIGNGAMRAGGVFGLAMLPVMLAIAAFSIWCVYRLCKAMERNPVFWIIAMFIPLVNFICLLVLNGSATSYLKSHGIHVGLLGAKL